MQKMENKLEDKNRFKIIWNVQEKTPPPKPIQVNSQLSKLSRLLAKMFPCVNCQDFMSGTSKDSVQDANSDKHQ